ncbi:MAG: DnaA/Hda family protein [Candidatus Hydrogenedentales bacterium]
MGELLVQEGVITAAQLGEALQKQKAIGGFLGQILVEQNMLSQPTLVSFLVKQCKIPHISLLDYDVGEELFQYVPKELCVRYHLLPIDKLGRILTLAMVDPLDIDALENVRKHCPDLKIKPILCDWRHFEAVSRRLFHESGSLGEEVTAASFGLGAAPKRPEVKPPEARQPEVRQPEPARAAVKEPSRTAPAQTDDEAVDAAVAALIEEAASTATKPSQPAELARKVPVSQSPASGASAAAPAPMAAPSIDPKMIATAMRDALQEAVAPLVEEQKRLASAYATDSQAHAATPAAAPALDIKELAGQLQTSLSGSVQDAVGVLIHEQQKFMAALAAENARTPVQQDFGPLAVQINEGLRGALAEALTPVLSAQVSEGARIAAQMPDFKDLTAQLQSSLSSTMQDAVGLLIHEQQKFFTALSEAETARSSSQPDFSQLASQMGEGMKSALRDAMLPLLAAQAESGKRGGNDSGSDVLAQALHQSLKEGLSALTEEMRSLSAQQGKQTLPSPELFASAIGESVRTAYVEQESRMAQLAESVTQTLKAVETIMQKSQEEREASTINVDSFRVSNLEPFPGTRSALEAADMSSPDALDSPGLGMGADERVRAALDSDHLLGGYTFDEFLAGSGNTFTVTVARAVAERASAEFSPLFVFGDVGVGKTHLLNAIGNEIVVKNRDLRVGYVSASHFASTHGQSLKDGTLDAFRESFCHWDVLIMDDIQFLAGKADAQEELFHVFTALCHEGRRVIIAGDKAPDQIAGLQPRLVSRFASGIVARLKAPEMDVRLAILKRLAQRQRMAVPEEILSLIATRITSDVRKMTGALRKVIAYAKLVGQEISRDMANEILSHLGIGEAA